MADTLGYLISVDPFLVYGGLNSPDPAITDHPGYLFEGIDVPYASTGVASDDLPSSPGYLLDNLEIIYGRGGLADPGPSGKLGADTRGYLIGLKILPGAEGDDSYLIGFDDDSVPSFPMDSRMVEIIYPVVPICETNKVITRMDNEEVRVTTKGAGLTVKDTDTIQFRVSTPYLATFLGALDTDRLDVFRLETPGYTPFGGTSEDNMVRVLGRGRPQREDRGLTQLVAITFRFISEI